MPVYRLAVPFVALLLAGIYLTYNVDTAWSLLIIGAMVVLVGGFILSPQINWWWWQRFAPDLPPGIHGLLERWPHYRTLSESDRREFRRRMFMFNEGTNFMPQGTDNIPLDARVMIAIAPVTMAFGEREFLFPNFENVVTYAHPFPSPQYPDALHISEVYTPDGVVMLSLPHVIHGYTDPAQYLNPAWYEYAKVFRSSYPGYDYGDWSGVTWVQLEAVSRFSHEALRTWIGLNDLDKESMGVAFFFLFPETFARILPDLNQQLQHIFTKK